MKFNKIFIPHKTTQQKGVHEIDVSRLSNIVAFVGRNGSGKSRILELLQQYSLDNVQLQHIVEGDIILPAWCSGFVARAQKFKKYFELSRSVDEVKRQFKNDRFQDRKLQTRLRNLKNQMKGELSQDTSFDLDLMEKEWESLKEQLKATNIRRVNNAQIQMVKKVLSEHEAGDVLNLLLEHDGSTPGTYNEISEIQENFLSFLMTIPHQLAAKRIQCLLRNEDFESSLEFYRYGILKQMLKDFLGKELTWDSVAVAGPIGPEGANVHYKGEWSINNRVFDYEELSEGEKTLFAYAVLFFLLACNPRLNISDSIILIDEPESHLHPSSELELLAGIRQALGVKGQLFIATHSLNILAELHYEEIFVVRDARIISPSRNTPEASLLELMGVPDRIRKLSDFVSAVSTWSYVHFFAQCFSDPTVIRSASVDDPQLVSLKKAINEYSEGNGVLLLDFGAGKGRLLEHLKAEFSFLQRCNYCALEPNPAHHDRLRSVGSQEVYITYESLPSNKFDFILLCNVLHEIELNDWVNNLNGIINSLKDSGSVILMEAKELTKGEKVGKIGYLLLGIEEIQVLFGLEATPLAIETRDDLTCVILPKKGLSLVTKDRVVKTLELLERNTFQKIRALRDNPQINSTYSYGRTAAFLSQMNINARFGISALVE